MIYLQLLLSFLQVGLFSIGGGYAALPLIQNQVVELHQWITMSEFTDLIAIAEMTPGPIAINAATFVGIRVGGVLGGLVGTLGFLFPSLVIVSVMGFVYFRYKGLTILQSILSSLRPAVVALIAGAGLSILLQVLFAGGPMTLEGLNWVGGLLFCLAFGVLRKFKCNPILVMLLCGSLSLLAGLIGLPA
ncbi:MAG: chromate transporter [Ruminiclostridium sp.]|nr:chromate transporter [Ruminiclostridium sp.]